MKRFYFNQISHKLAKYILPMFPYPSGSLHLGHFRIYSVSHVLNLYYKLLGYKTIHPIGWDSFGLPAERAAIANGTHPREWTQSNISKMKDQLLRCGIQFDWDREFSTHDPEYYAHTQRIFLNLFRNGLVYKDYAIVNYDPLDQTVLANEQVIDGRAERSGALVESRFMEQYFITAGRFAEALDNELQSDQLIWPSHIKKIQRNWIEKVNGGFIEGQLVIDGKMERLRVFVEDSIKSLQEDGLVAVVGAQNMSILNSMDTDIKEEWSTFVANLRLTNKNTQGFDTGLRIRVGKTIEVPLFIAPFLAHRSSDYLLLNRTRSHNSDWIKFADEHSVKDESDSRGGIRKVSLQDEDTFQEGSWYGLRDWAISRQRKWGTPIPIINCNSCGSVPVDDDQLPIKHEKAGMPTTCPKCGSPKASFEKDTLDTFFDSAWYFLRFLDPRNVKNPFEREKVSSVDFYIGGREHATMHLLYARLLCKCLVSTGMIDSSKEMGNGLLSRGEPFARFVDVGVVQAYSFHDGKNYITPVDANRLMNQGEKGIKRKLEKMGKSKLNGVDPLDIVDQYGADAVRFYIISKTKVAGDMEWTLEGIQGALRFIEKLENITNSVRGFEAYLVNNQFRKAPLDLDRLDMDKSLADLIRAHDKTLALVRKDIERLSLHTLTAHIYKFANTLQKHLSAIPQDFNDPVLAKQVEKKCVATLILLSYPLATKTCTRLLANHLVELDFEFPTCFI